MNVDVRNSLVYLDYEGNPITEPKEGQIATCENLESAFRYTNGQWEKISVDMNMSVYNINSQIISQLPEITQEGLEKGKQAITEFAIDTANRYFMLLCRDINYYTIFDTGSIKLRSPKFCEEVAACVAELGTIKSIDLKEDGEAIEIWIDHQKTETEIETIVMFLFGYDVGVIECRK